jgi:cell division septal protein FtsQ
MGLGGEVDFLRRQNSRSLNREKRIHTIKIKGFHLFLILLVVGLVAFGAYKAGRFLLTWDKLNVKKFKLVNSPLYQNQRINKILSAYTGNILGLRLGDLKANLLKIKEVKEVSITRHLPSTIEIRFNLRQPLLQLQSGNTYYLADDEGVVLIKKKKPQPGMVNIRGVAVKDMERIIPFIPEIVDLQETIEYVTFRDPYGIVLKIKGIQESFSPGDRRFRAKLKYYLKLRELPALSKEKIKHVDLRFDDRIYLEYNEEVRSKHEK